MRNDQKGLGILETVIALGIAIAAVVGLMSIFNQQTKQSNYSEFRAQVSEFRMALAGQVLNNPDNCKCLFQGASNFSDTGTANLTGFTQPTQIGRYKNADCSGTPAIPFPLITTTEKNGIKLKSIGIRNITATGSSYTGQLEIRVATTKKVVGPPEVLVDMPVNVAVSTVAAGTVAFESCSFTSAGAAGSGTLEGELIGSPITVSFSSTGSQNTAYPLSSYAGATFLHFDCHTACKDNDRRSYVNIHFRKGGVSIFKVAACQPGEINDDNTAHDRNAGIIPIPAQADEVYMERVIESCGNRQNTSTIKFFK